MDEQATSNKPDAANIAARANLARTGDSMRSRTKFPLEGKLIAQADRNRCRAVSAGLDGWPTRTQEVHGAHARTTSSRARRGRAPHIRTGRGPGPRHRGRLGAG